MYALRTTLYPPPGIGEPTTLITRECDLAVPVTTALAELIAVTPTMLVLADLFDVPDDASIEATVLEGSRRWEADYAVEDHARTLYYWTVMQWRQVRDGGVLIMPTVAPMPSGLIRNVFSLLVEHPEYRNQTLIAFGNDGVEVKATPAWRGRPPEALAPYLN